MKTELDVGQTGVVDLQENLKTAKLTMVELGLHWLKRECWSDAASVLIPAGFVTTDPEQIRALIAHAWSCDCSGNYEQAIKDYTIAGATKELLNLGKRCLRNGKFELAISAYKAANQEMDRADLEECCNNFLHRGETARALEVSKYL